MAGKTMSDFAESVRKAGLDIGWRETKKEDMARLRKSNLPQFNWFDLPYNAFTQDNAPLMDFFAHNFSKGDVHCVRALPNEDGRNKGYTRKPFQGLRGFEDSKKVLEQVIKSEEEKFWDISITSNPPAQPYGGVIFVGRRQVIGEISGKLDKLTAMEENPYASFIWDRAEPGRYEATLNWLLEGNEESRKTLLKALRYLICTKGEDIPIILRGYFEFVVSGKGEIKFLDYKTSDNYLAGLDS
jgi:hypothetical protein